MTSGNPPAALQMLGFDIKDWAAEGFQGDLGSVAEAEGWDAVVPLALQEFSRHDGKWIAAPVNVRSTNWMWINKAALDAAVGEAPGTWEELIAVLDATKANGIAPLAHGGQAWQDGTVFNSVVLGLGADFYHKAIIEQDPEALGSEMMVEAFARMEVLRGYFDENFSGRDWNLASAMVINGKAGMQAMGDWAKGEFVDGRAGAGRRRPVHPFPWPAGPRAVRRRTIRHVRRLGRAA